VPLKQAVISPSALSLLYPEEGIPGYLREVFIEDLLREHVKKSAVAWKKVRRKCRSTSLKAVLTIKINPSGALLSSFNRSEQPGARALLGCRACAAGSTYVSAGGDRDSTHSADVDYATILLPSLFQLNVCNFYVALAGEPDRVRVLEMIPSTSLQPHHRVCVGVVAPIDPHVETPEEVRDQRARGGPVYSRCPAGHD